MTTEIIFFISLLLLAGTYIIYPMLTIAVAVFRKKRENISASLPAVSVLMPMHNEDKVLRLKAERLLALDYPSEKIEIILGSDASTDNTDLIAGELVSQSENIHYVRSEKRRGKAGMLNMMAKQAKGEILVITDANVMPYPDCLKLITVHFSEKKIGLCDTRPVTFLTADAGIATQEKLYSSFEMRLKNSEGKAWGTTTGPYGGFYAVRKELFPAIPEKMLVDDLFVGLSVLDSGYNSINEERAVVTEDIPSDIKSQFHRRVRISAGSFQNLFYWGPFPGGLFSGASRAFLFIK